MHLESLAIPLSELAFSSLSVFYWKERVKLPVEVCVSWKTLTVLQDQCSLRNMTIYTLSTRDVMRLRRRSVGCLGKAS